MADLTTLEEKLAECTGLAGAAQETTRKVESLLDDDSLLATVRKLREEAEETESRCIEVAAERDGKKTAILDKARETKSEAVEMMRTYLGEDSDELDGFEFLIMAEAGEVGHWAILGKLNESAGEGSVQELVDWALPIQEGHLGTVRGGSLELAAEEGPSSRARPPPSTSTTGRRRATP
ncbi:MAG: hypothetical protein ACOYD4_13880, partial [Solirubrobacterales bacterium]